MLCIKGNWKYYKELQIQYSIYLNPVSDNAIVN